jgi:hypothetical protein
MSVRAGPQIDVAVRTYRHSPSAFLKLKRAMKDLGVSGVGVDGKKIKGASPIENGGIESLTARRRSGSD